MTRSFRYPAAVFKALASDPEGFGAEYDVDDGHPRTAKSGAGGRGRTDTPFGTGF
jgi:hypothetical protein